MTDPISSLADQLLALINSSPRTPTKAEIERVLRTTVPEIMHPLILVQRMNAEAELCPPTPFNDCSVCCPCTIDGVHSWTTHDAKGNWCPCGASKP